MGSQVGGSLRTASPTSSSKQDKGTSLWTSELSFLKEENPQKRLFRKLKVNIKRKKTFFIAFLWLCELHQENFIP